MPSDKPMSNRPGTVGAMLSGRAGKTSDHSSVLHLKSRHHRTDEPGPPQSAAMTPFFVIMDAKTPNPKRQIPKKDRRCNSDFSLEILWSLELWCLRFALSDWRRNRG